LGITRALSPREATPIPLPPKGGSPPEVEYGFNLSRTLPPRHILNLTNKLCNEAITVRAVVAANTKQRQF